MNNRTAIDLIKANVTRNYVQLSKTEIATCSEQIHAALDIIESAGHKRTFKGWDLNRKPTSDDDKVIYQGYLARERMINSVLPFAFKKSAEFAGDNIDKLEGILQETALNLGRAAELYDYKTGYAVTTFFAYWIFQSAMYFVRKNSSSFKLSPVIHSLRNNIRKLNESREFEGLPKLSKQGLAEHFDTSLSHVESALNIPIEVSGDETESDGTSEGDSTKFELFATPENDKEESIKHYADVINSDLAPQNPLAVVLFSDVLEDMANEKPITLEQEQRILDYLKQIN